MASATNTLALAYPAATTAGQDAVYAGIWTLATRGGFLLGQAVTGNPPALEVGQQYTITDGSFILTKTTGVTTELGRQEELKGLIAGTRYISLHTADPGITGANEFVGAGYLRQAIASTEWRLA